MDEKDLVEGMREYISLLQKEGRYSSAKSYQDAMNSFIRYSGTDRIPYTYGEFYQFNLSSCIRQQNSLTAQFVSFSLANLANIFYPPRFLQ